LKAIVLHSVVPVRREARESAEQETQLLFAQTCTILDEQPQWLHIRNDEDGEEGWVDRKMVSVMTEQEWEQYSTTNKQALVKMPMAYAVSKNNGQTIPLTAGTRLPDYKDGQFSVLGVPFCIDAQMVAEVPLELTEQNLMHVVRFFINTPYLWGGKNALGMDCSGFSQIVLSIFGRGLKRNASEQMREGKQVAGLNEAQAGDLVFFDHEDGRVSHVGILLDKERVVHCSGRVKVEKVDEKGIWNAEYGKYSHHLVMIKRKGLPNG